MAKIKGGGEVAVKVQRAGLKALFDQDLKVTPTTDVQESTTHPTRGVSSDIGVLWPVLTTRFLSQIFFIKKK